MPKGMTCKLACCGSLPLHDLLGTETTKNLLMKCRLRCRLCSRILTALASLHHSMESGHLRLGLCVVYRPLLEELRQDVAASLTALSGLVLGSLAGDRHISLTPTGHQRNICLYLLCL